VPKVGGGLPRVSFTPGAHRAQPRMALVRGSTTAIITVRSEAVAAVWAGVHVAPMMRTTITMITGIRLSSVSCFVGPAGGVLVKVSSNSMCGSQVPPGRALRLGVTGRTAAGLWCSSSEPDRI
jgi:hypothetical protein